MFCLSFQFCELYKKVYYRHSKSINNDKKKMTFVMNQSKGLTLKVNLPNIK